ncbi:hypothetical protein V8C86DRAFT_3144067, partial [Haematococcus lacustris]
MVLALPVGDPPQAGDPPDPTHTSSQDPAHSQPSSVPPTQQQQQSSSPIASAPTPTHPVLLPGAASHRLQAACHASHAPAPASSAPCPSGPDSTSDSMSGSMAGMTRHPADPAACLQRAGGHELPGIEQAEQAESAGGRAVEASSSSRSSSEAQGGRAVSGKGGASTVIEMEVGIQGQEGGRAEVALATAVGDSAAVAVTPDCAAAGPVGVADHRLLAERLGSMPAVPGSAHPSVGNPHYKTTLCRAFKETGGCRRGATCAFAHGLEELRPSRSPAQRNEAGGLPPPCQGQGQGWQGHWPQQGHYPEQGMGLPAAPFPLDPHVPQGAYSGAYSLHQHPFPHHPLQHTSHPYHLHQQQLNGAVHHSQAPAPLALAHHQQHQYHHHHQYQQQQHHQQFQQQQGQQQQQQQAPVPHHHQHHFQHHRSHSSQGHSLPPHAPHNPHSQQHAHSHSHFHSHSHSHSHSHPHFNSHSHSHSYAPPHPYSHPPPQQSQQQQLGGGGELVQPHTPDMPATPPRQRQHPPPAPTPPSHAQASTDWHQRAPPPQAVPSTQPPRPPAAAERVGGEQTHSASGAGPRSGHTDTNENGVTHAVGERGVGAHVGAPRGPREPAG